MIPTLKPTEAYLGPYQISMIELFCANGVRLLAVDYFFQKSSINTSPLIVLTYFPPEMSEKEILTLFEYFFNTIDRF